VERITVKSSIKNDPAFPRSKQAALLMYQNELGLPFVSKAKLNEIADHLEGPVLECKFTHGKNSKLEQLVFKPLNIVDGRRPPYKI
jgi:hypothetical protein